MSKVLWMIGQAAVIGVLTVGMFEGTGRTGPIGTLFMVNVILVAFFTAAFTKLFDWFRRPRAVARTGQERQTKRDPLSLSTSSWFLGQLPQKAL